MSLERQKIIVERRGGHPEHLLEDAPPDLSERNYRKKEIADYLQMKHSQAYNRNESPRITQGKNDESRIDRNY